MRRVSTYILALLTLTYFLKSDSHSFACSTNKCLLLSLNGQWNVSNSNDSISLHGLVPGQIHLDLLREKLIPEPYKGFNDDKLVWIALEDKWVYSRNISLDSILKSYKKILIYFEGIDTIASVFLYNVRTETKQFLFNATNQHRQYVCDVTDHLVVGDNTIYVELFSAAKLSHKYALEYPYFVDQQFTYFPNTNRNFVRKAQSDFGWDWGPAFAPVGLWKDVSLISFDEFILSDFIPIVYWNETTNDFEIKLTVGIINTDSFNGKLVATLEGIITHSTTFSCNQPECNVVTNVNVPVNNVSPWWPNGYGHQTLYNISVQVISESGTKATAIKSIGFRKIELLQEKYSNEDGLSFYFSINHQSVFVKGSNWIPADAFAGRVTTEQIDQLLTSAVISNQNMVRVWGGGIYQQDEFYDLCDQKGILVWQEFMFACALYPRDASFLENVREEIRSQVRRLAHHPSIILWSGNNENQDTAVNAGTAATVDYTVLYDDVIRKTLYREDTSRPFWPSSPSNGDLVVDVSRALFIQRWGESQNPYYGDIHRYDYVSLCTDVTKFPRPRFASEYGFQSYPSLLSLEQVMESVSDLGNDSPFMLHRQHHPDGNPQLATQLQMHFNLPNNTNGVERFDNFIFLTQLVQGICMQSQTEHYRRTRDETGHTMGTLYWQLNDIWQGQSWSSIEYDGRWKVLHYFVKRFYAPILLSGYHLDTTFYLYVINDQNRDLNVSATVDITQWNGYVVKTIETKASIGSYISKRVLTITEISNTYSIKDCYFSMKLVDNELHQLLSTNYYFPFPLKEVSLPKAVVNIEQCFQTGEREYRITVSSTKLALYVFLETKYSGYFSDNAFVMEPGSVVVVLFLWKKIGNENACESISIRTLASVYYS